MKSSMKSSAARVRRLTGMAAGAALVAAVLPQAAPAAVVSQQTSGLVTYQAAAGEVNRPRPSVANGFLRIRETNGATPLSAGGNCDLLTERLVQCPAPSGMRIDLGDRDDTYLGTSDGFYTATVLGGSGNDEFLNGRDHRESYFGGDGTDTASYFLAEGIVSLTLDVEDNDGEALERDFIDADVENLSGGPASDVLTGNGANNVLSGGDGADRLTGNGGNDVFTEDAIANGPDVFDGGPGTDRISYADRVLEPVSVSLNGTADDGEEGEGDNAFSGVENITGTRFSDILLGSNAANSISGLAGADLIQPFGGSDTVLGGDGNDGINIRDGERDVARGGDGSDSITRDAIDDVTF